MDGDSITNEKTKSRNPIPIFFDVISLLQSIRVRCRSVYSDVMDREFIESQPYYVFCCGFIFWIVFILALVL